MQPTTDSLQQNRLTGMVGVADEVNKQHLASCTGDRQVLKHCTNQRCTKKKKSVKIWSHLRPIWSLRTAVVPTHLVTWVVNVKVMMWRILS